MSDKLALVVLISGNGSNLQSIIDAIEQDTLRAEIRLVISNNPDAYGLERAARHGIPSLVIDHRDFDRRASFDAEIGRQLQSRNPDFIVLAGFMRILGPELINRFPDRILNIHPSLLPEYKGLNTHQRVLQQGEARHGVSIHLVTAELDDGPVLLQGSYPIEAEDRVEDLQRKGHALEHRMYPEVLRWLSEGRITIDEGRLFQQEVPLDAPLQFDAWPVDPVTRSTTA